MLTNKDLFEAAFAAYAPEATDAAENIPFYATWRGMKAVLAKYGHTDPYTAPLDVHGICSWAEKNGQWAEIVRVLPMHEPKSPEKERRYHSMFYASEPALPTEEAARLIFESQYRSNFPGKRVNSKHAKEKWEKVKDQAFKFATEEYNANKADYDKATAAHKAREAAEEVKWQAKLKTYNDAVALVQKLKEE